MHRLKVHLSAAGILSVVLLAACGGSTGPQGPAGPPANRSNLYCTSSTATLDPSNLTVTVACKSKTDIPWEGGCSAVSVPAGMYLATDAPVSWDNPNIPAAWICTWAAQ